MTRGRVAVVLGVLLAVLAAALLSRRGAHAPSAEVGAAAPGDGTGDPGSADARPAAVPLAAQGRAAGPEPKLEAADEPASTTAAVLTVSVLDAAGTPVPDASVQWIAEPPASGTTDRRGHVRWPIDGRVDGFLVATAPGFLPSYEEVVLADQASMALELRLRAGRRVTGWVHRTSGAPVVGVSVAPRVPPPSLTVELPGSDSIVTETLPTGEVVVRQAQGRTHAGWMRLAEQMAAYAATTTDATGRFVLVQPDGGDAAVDVVEYGPQRDDEWSEPLIVASATVRYEGRPLDVVLDPEVAATGGVRFRLVPPADGGVHVFAGVRLVDPVASTEVAGGLRRRRAEPWIDPKAAGRFDIHQVPDGDFVVEVSVDRWVPRALPVRIRDGAIVDLGDVPLEVGATLRGRVVAAPATDLGSPLVVATPVGEPGVLGQQRARADATGAFALDSLCVGAHRLLVEGSGASAGRRFVVRAPEVFQVRPGDTTLDAPWIVEEAFQLEVVAESTDGSGAAASVPARVEVVRDGGEVVAVGSVGGAHTLRAWIPAGRYVVRRAGATSGQEVTVDGSQPDTEVRLSGTGSVLPPRPSPRPRPPSDACGAGRCG